MQYNCIIVEDEPIASEIIESYIKQVPVLNLTAICSNAKEAFSVLHLHKIDVIFLDIHLPQLKGLDFLSTLTYSPKVIITTAYHEYALRSYDYNVIDYLLKPIEFGRFLTAIRKLDLISGTESVQQNKTDVDPEHIFFNMNKKKVKVYFHEINYIESQKEYIKIVTQTKEVVTKFPLTEMESILSKNDFIRVHRSFIVAKKKIEAFNTTDLEVAGKQIPIGRSYKELVQSVLDQMFK